VGIKKVNTTLAHYITMISKQDIDKIFDAARVEDVVSEYVTLKKRGVNLIGLCPFHDEKTPSFYVSPVKGIYKCFGCGKGGNAVNFLMDKSQMTYPEALRYLAKKYNIEIEEKEQTAEEIQSQNERESLMLVSAFAQKHFTENLLTTDEGKSIGMSYFKERGFREDVILKFQLGYSANKRNELSEAAIKAGYKAEFLIKSGLAIESKKEEAQSLLPSEQTAEVRTTTLGKDDLFDRFSGRVMFPIHSISGKVIGFGGRTLRTDTKKIAKYINSPESEIYHKSDVLYGIYFAKNEIVKQNNCFLVEGYTDVISMHQAGIENVVASSGTSLTVGQIRLIRRYTNNITILYDGDSAGIKASFRGIDLILEEGLNVKVLLFPDGEDPDSYSKKVSNTDLKTFIDSHTQDFISFKTNLLLKDVKHDPIKKATLIKEIVESIALIPEAIHRSVYVKECSRLMEMEEAVLLSELNKIRNKQFFDRKHTQAEENANSGIEDFIQEELVDNSILKTTDYEHQEREIIRLLINYSKHELSFYNAETRETSTRTVIDVLINEFQILTMQFKNQLYQTVWDEFVRHFNNNEILDYTYFVNHSTKEISILTIDLISSPYSLSNWSQHSIDVPIETDILKKSIYHALDVLQSKKVEFEINTIQQQIKETDNIELALELMQKQNNLLAQKKLLNAKLGRIILK
jgi:DNA primase